jgi:hypothetical protein
MTTVLFGPDGKTDATTYAPPETPEHLDKGVVLTIEEFSNPWRDEDGRFAEKGHSYVPGAGEYTAQIHNAFDVGYGRAVIDEAVAPRIMKALEDLRAGTIDRQSSIDRDLIAYERKRADGSKLTTDFEKNIAAIEDGNNRRLNHWAKKIAADDAIGNKPLDLDNVDDRKFRTQLDEQMAVIGDNPAMAMAVERFGKVPIIALAVGDQAGFFSSTFIGMNRPIGNTRATSTPDPLTPDAKGRVWSVDDSIQGTLRHEYGHYVESEMRMLDYATKGPSVYTAWEKERAGWNAGASTTRTSDPAWLDHDAKGLSAYATTNSQETFAETFTLVTHPSFDYEAHAAGTPVQGMVDSMLDMIGGEGQ